MLAKAQKWGNSLAVRIPKTIAEECGITVDSAVEVPRENDVIIIKPVKKKFSLEMLLAGETPENLHTEVCPLTTLHTTSHQDPSRARRSAGRTGWRS